jgi:hypothetical protein
MFQNYQAQYNQRGTTKVAESSPVVLHINAAALQRAQNGLL